MIVCAMHQPGGGTFVLRIGAAQSELDARRAALAPACRALASDAPAATASVTTMNGGSSASPLSPPSGGAGGVVLSNLGVVGAQLSHFGRTSDAVVGAELAAYRPDLIVLAFGTNEGFSAEPPRDGFEAASARQIARIRRLAAPDVPILLLGAPDAATRAPAAAGGRRLRRRLGECRALLERARRGSGASRGDAAPPIWDWSAAMGGRCASSAWRRCRPDARRPCPLHPQRRRPDRRR